MKTNDPSIENNRFEFTLSELIEDGLRRFNLMLSDSNLSIEDKRATIEAEIKRGDLLDVELTLCRDALECLDRERRGAKIITVDFRPDNEIEF